METVIPQGLTPPNPADEFDDAATVTPEAKPEAKPEEKPEEKPEKPKNPIAAAKEEWFDANKNHRDCEAALVKAKTRLAAAGHAMTESRPQMTLHELNLQQRRITRTESRRRVRAQDTLDKLAMSINPRREPHPPLFTVEKPEEK